MESGDLCSFGRSPDPAHYVTHYRCDDYRDGTVTDCTTGKVVRFAKPGAPLGFNRQES